MSSGGRDLDVSQAVTMFKNIRPQYEFDTIWSESERGRVLMNAVNRLDLADRTMILLYAEVSSVSKLAKMIGVSKTRMYLEIQRIREKIRQNLKEDEDTGNADLPDDSHLGDR